MSHSLAESFGLSRPDGALVGMVAPNSAAAKAGLQLGDIILQVNGETISRSGDLSSRISLATPGATVQLKVWRDKKTQEIAVKLGFTDELQSVKEERDTANQAGQLGLTLRRLTQEEQLSAHIKGGLVVEEVAGASARANLMPDDVLLAINGVALTSVKQVKAVLDKKPKFVALLVLRDGERIFVPVELG
jgi:serine protease Do